MNNIAQAIAGLWEGLEFIPKKRKSGDFSPNHYLHPCAGANPTRSTIKLSIKLPSIVKQSLFC
jgi:hypothetical protein